MSRYRHFTFTLNNYTDEDETFLSSLPTKYIVWGYEEAPTTGTPHLQGFVSFENARSHSAAAKLLRRCHVESARRPAEAAAYCKKDGIYFEAGEPPSEDVLARGRERWDDIRRLAELGEFENIPADVIIRYPRNLLLIRQLAQSRDCPATIDSLENYWIHGPTGIGKSRTVRDVCRAAGQAVYLKDSTKWWDGYHSEPVVLLEEFEPTHVAVLGGYLKTWADHYAVRVESKGGGMLVRPRHIIVTSNYDMESLFTMSGLLLPLQRRFKTIDMENGDTFNL